MAEGKFKDREEVKIRWTGSAIEVEPEKAYIKRRGTVDWTCAEGDWEVVMEGTDPLEDGPKLGGSKGQKNGGRTRDDADKTGKGGDPDSPKGTHKYTVRVKVDGEWKDRDPDLVVGPKK